MPENTSWRLVYEHLVFIENHWTDQLQNQQQRVGSILTVTGFLLGFSGLTGASEFEGHWGEPAAISFGVGLLALALGLLAGLAAMRPTQPIEPKAPWLDPTATHELGDGPSEASYEALALRTKDSIVCAKHAVLLKKRRVQMSAQIILTLIGLTGLGGSILGLLR